jgi:hypothetical protein
MYCSVLRELSLQYFIDVTKTYFKSTAHNQYFSAVNLTKPAANDYSPGKRVLSGFPVGKCLR